MKIQSFQSFYYVIFIVNLNSKNKSKVKSKKMIQQSQKSQEINLDDKQVQQIIHQSPNLNVLKKMFARPKNYMTIKPHDQSLLFDRKNSMSVLKAYRNHKKIANEEFSRKKQNQVDKKLQNQSTMDSPQKVNFIVESVKYNFEISSKRKEYYDQILKMIQEAHNYEKNKSQKIQQQQDNFDVNLTRTLDNQFLEEKILIKSLNFEEREIPRLSPKMIYSSTLSPREKIKKSNDFFRIRSIKSSNQQSLANRIENLTSNQQKIDASIEKQSINKVQNFQDCEKKIQQTKIKKQLLNPENQYCLPKIKAVKSTRIFQPNQNNNIRKGYMFFHFEAKSHIKQHRQKLKDEAKIKSLMISGITATSFAVIDLQTMTPIAHRNFDKKIEIASISKVMTCYLSLLACKKYQIDPKKYLVRVSRQASQLIGTSAELQQGDCFTLQQALYALMLPSGNDASYAVAQAIGKIIQRHKTKQTKKSYYETFIAHMNLLSKQLKLQQEWRNSSGIPSNPNRSTPQAICLLTIAAMMDEKFKQIVSCKQFEATIKNQRTGLKKSMKWKNTNKLLNEGWQGVKTGTTDSAGHCLMAKKDRYLICVFDTNTLSKRFTECSQLYALVKNKQRYLFPEKWD